jgi:phenylalanyl-tRNA synthetase beta chain
VLAFFGELHPELLGALDLKGRAVAFEIHLDRIPEPKSRSRTRPPLEMNALLPVNRDFAFIVDETIGADAIIRAARGADKALITDARIFDLFTGEGVGPGKKSLALTVRLQPRDKTLTEAEIDTVVERIVAAVAKATGGSLRS